MKKVKLPLQIEFVVPDPLPHRAALVVAVGARVLVAAAACASVMSATSAVGGRLGCTRSRSDWRRKKATAELPVYAWTVEIRRNDLLPVHIMHAAYRDSWIDNTCAFV